MPTRGQHQGHVTAAQMVPDAPRRLGSHPPNRKGTAPKEPSPITIRAASAPDARPTYQLDQLASTVVNAMLDNLGNPAGELARAGLELAVDQGVKLNANQLETLDHGLTIER